MREEIGEAQVVGLALLVEGIEVDGGEQGMLLAIEGGVARAGGWGKGIGIDAEKRSLVGGEALDERAHGRNGGVKGAGALGGEDRCCGEGGEEKQSCGAREAHRLKPLA